MKVALYARVSTTDKGQDVDLQLYELRRFAQVRGWETLEFIDDGVSGTNARRPALDELLKAVKRRHVDAVAVWKLDRLGRSLANLLHLMNEFETYGIAFISLRENIDLTTASGRLMAQMIGAFAEFEREIIRERVKAGIASAKRKGKKVGRAATAPIVLKQIIELAADTKQSMRQIAKNESFAGDRTEHHFSSQAGHDRPERIQILTLSSRSELNNENWCSKNLLKIDGPEVPFLLLPRCRFLPFNNDHFAERLW